MNDEKADLILRKARNALEPPRLPSVFKEITQPNEHLTDERLMAAYEALATIISTHGEIYVPLFKRLHEEIENRRRHDEYVKLAQVIHLEKLER